MSNKDNKQEAEGATEAPQISAPVIAVNGSTADVSVAAVEDSEGAPKMSEMRGVRYIGHADIKILTIADLGNLRIEDPKKDLVWSKDNDFFIPASDINAATRDWLYSQRDFSVE